MIVDCFTFFNEIDLLEMRVNTLAPYVDAFVLCEANRTFQGAEKPYHFSGDKSGSVWPNAFGTGRPLYIVRTDLSSLDEKTLPSVDAWLREATQRRAIIQRLQTLSLKDRIILSDVDEIPYLGQWTPRETVIPFYQGRTIVWHQDLYYYWINIRCWKWTGSVSCTWETLREQFHCDLQALRDYRHRVPLAIDGGWHFSFLGGAEAIKTKIEAFSHTEYRHCADPDNIQRALTEGWKENRDVFGRDNLGMKFELMPDDSHLPAYLVANKERFKDWWYRP